jgi:hypothetical protein
MASIIDVWSLYKFRLADDTDEYILIRTLQPSYPNWSQTQENFAERVEMQKREKLLKLICESRNLTYKRNFSFIGEFHGYPNGELLFSENGLFKLQLFYCESAYGHPWIILDCAESIASFFDYFKTEDYEKNYGGIKPKGEPIGIEATLVTEKDFDISVVPHFDLKDTRPLFNE